jgi:hypothetical protein
MVRRVLVFLLILLALPLYSQSSPKPESVYTHCFTDTEWAAFEEEVWKEEEAAIVEAVNEAVKPYVIVVKKQEREIFWWKVGFWSAVAAAAGSLIWAALK